MVRTWPTAWPTLTVMVPFELPAFAPCTLDGEEKISLLAEPEGQPLTVLFS